MDEKMAVTLNCPHYWPKMKPQFPCDDCSYGEVLCPDLCPRFQERRMALGAELGSCDTCAINMNDCLWRDPPPELRAMINENAPDWQIRRWLKEYYKDRLK